MPLFFIIAIGAGAFTLGATAVDVTSVRQQNRERIAQLQTDQGASQSSNQSQVQTFQTMADCQRAMAQQGLPATVCQPRY